MSNALPGFGLVCTFHAAPFQCSTSVRVPFARVPTAHTLVEELAATPDRRLASVPALGLACTFHADPFQCRVSVLFVVPLSYAPTAQMSDGELAATALRLFARAPTFGLV